MSVHEGERGGWVQAVERKAPSEQGAFTEFCFCMPTADTAGQTQTDEGGGKNPISTTKRLCLILDVLSSSPPNDELCS